MATQPKAGDFTGRQKQKLSKKAADELKARQEEITLSEQVEEEKLKTEVVDYTTDEVEAPVIVDSVEEVGVTLADDTVIIRVTEEIIDMTFGAGNILSFSPGRKYKVPADLASHLEDKGYVWRQ